jgi:hypothetical protein
MSISKAHHSIFLLGSALLVIGLPVSHWLLSVSILLLSANWLTQVILYIFTSKILPGRWKTPDAALSIISLLKTRKSLWIILSIYFMHLVWLFNTRDFTYALHDLRIKLPLLALPLIYGTSLPLDKKLFKLILQLFTATVFVSSLISTYHILGFSKVDLIDSRYASLFISHIRFSLIVVLVIYSMLYLIFFDEIAVKPLERKLYILVVLWFVCFLILLQSFTGIVIFLILLPVAIIWWARFKKQRRLISIAYAICTLIVVFIFTYSFYSFNRYHKKHDINYSELDSYTINGSRYKNEPELKIYENGHLIWIYVAEKELRNEWNRRSSMDYDSLDRKGQSLQMTLIRYLTSLGYRKDSLGVSQLSEEDIGMIERGYTNYLFNYKFALYPRIYVLLWEIESYKNTGNPSGKSLGQRLEYLKTGIHIVKRHFWFGTGTGDADREFRIQYKLDDSKLKPEWQHRTHNQFITFLLTFGIFGFAWFLFAFFIPPVMEKRYSDFLFTIFFLIGILSMLNEDTLETHVGVSFFAFFYSFFLFSIPGKQVDSNETS